MRGSAPAACRLLALALLAAALVPAGAAAAARDDAEALRAVNAFTPNNELTFNALEEVIDARRARMRALRRPLRSRSRIRRWAAVYVAHNLARTRADRRLLAKRLRDRDPSVRALAAFGLIGRGEKRAIPVLIQLLASRRYLVFSDPPERLATAANERLVRRTRADFGFRFTASSKARRRALARWRSWWRQVRRTIRWDNRARRYRWDGARGRRPGRRRARSAAAAFDRPAPLEPASSTATPGTEAITIKVKIELHAAAGAEAGNLQKVLDLVSQAQNGLNNGQQSQSGRCIGIRIELQVERRQGSGRPGFHQIQVRKGKSDLERRSHVNQLPLEGTSLGRLPRPGESTKGLFHDDDGARAFGHEVMHLLGIGDEYNKNARGYAEPWDPDSLMSNHLKGSVLQRHLDRLAELFGPPNQGCEKYTLNFADWKSEIRARTEGSGSGARHVIGEFASAQVAADFWLNPRTNQVFPAGDTPCDQTNLTGPCPGDIDPSTGSGMSRAGRAEANAGQAKCSSVRLRHVERLFKTTVTGSRQSGRFSLNVEPGDAQQAQYVCDPPATPPSKTVNLIRDGMGAATNAAGQTARSFSIGVPALGGPPTSDSFRFDNGRNRAAGDVNVARLE